MQPVASCLKQVLLTWEVSFIREIFSKIFFTVLCDGFDQRGVAFTIAQATTWGKKRIRIRIRIWIWI